MAKPSSERSSNESGTKESKSDPGFAIFPLILPPLQTEMESKADNADSPSSLPASGDITHLTSIPFVGLISSTTGLLKM